MKLPGSKNRRLGAFLDDISSSIVQTTQDLITTEFQDAGLIAEPTPTTDPVVTTLEPIPAPLPPTETILAETVYDPTLVTPASFFEKNRDMVIYGGAAAVVVLIVIMMNAKKK